MATMYELTTAKLRAELGLDARIVFGSWIGSTLYRTDHDGSDTDIFLAYVLPYKEYLSLWRDKAPTLTFKIDPPAGFAGRVWDVKAMEMCEWMVRAQRSEFQALESVLSFHPRIGNQTNLRWASVVDEVYSNFDRVKVARQLKGRAMHDLERLQTDMATNVGPDGITSIHTKTFLHLAQSVMMAGSMRQRASWSCDRAGWGDSLPWAFGADSTHTEVALCNTMLNHIYNARQNGQYVLSVGEADRLPKWLASVPAKMDEVIAGAQRFMEQNNVYNNPARYQEVYYQILRKGLAA